MTSDSFDYPALVQSALRGMVRKVLRQVEESGLPGVHHFYITYDTRHPEAVISEDLKARYPETITIILQHDFRDLSVEDDRFSVVLRFSGLPQLLRVPFDALVTFYDPTEEMMLQFDPILPAPRGPAAVPDPSPSADEGAPASLKIPVRAVLAAADQMQAEKEAATEASESEEESERSAPVDSAEAAGSTSRKSTDKGAKEPKISAVQAIAEAVIAEAIDGDREATPESDGTATVQSSEETAPGDQDSREQGSEDRDLKAKDNDSDANDSDGSDSDGKDPDDEPPTPSNVVSIDAFRRK